MVKKTEDWSNLKSKSLQRQLEGKVKKTNSKSISSYWNKSISLKSKQKLAREKIKFKCTSQATNEFNQSKATIGKMIPPKTQREMQSFFNSSENVIGDDGWLWEISALGKSEISKMSMKILRQKQNIDSDFRESKTPRDMIPRLNAYDVVKEK